MWKHDRRSLPDWIEDGYELLIAEAQKSDGELSGFSHEEAHNLLLAHDAFPDEPRDAEYAIGRLLDSGWLYEADERLRITDSDWPPGTE